MKKHTLRFRSVDQSGFNEIKNGIKTVETRAASTRYEDIQKDDELIIEKFGIVALELEPD